jgi:hypothetical protein
VAFLFGWQFIEGVIGDGMTALLIGLALGIVFGWLAVRFVRGIAYFIAFFAGAFALPYFLGIFGIDLNWLLSAIIGGLIGLALIAMAFNLGLVLLTSWVGAGAISRSVQGWLEIGETLAGVLFIGLLLFGIIYQTRHSRRK